MHTQPEIIDKYCRNCGTKLEGKYCHECGQERYDVNHLTLKYFISNFLDTIFNFESKFWKSLLAVIVRPGFLTNEYISGRLVPYVMPFKLFIFVLFIILLFDSGEFLDKSEEVQKENDEIAYAITNNIMTENNMTYEQVRDRINSRFNEYTTILLLAMTLMMALPLKLFHISSGRLLSEHLVFSAHFFTFVAISLFAADIVERFLSVEVFVILLPLQFVYLLIAFRRVYNERWILTIGETMLLFIFYFMILFIGFYAYVFIIGYMI
jgi:hypothetical protein